MPSLLRSLSIGKVDFVDRPADPHARTAIWKRDGAAPDDDPKEGNVPEIPTLTDEVRKGLPEEAVDIIDALTAALEDAQSGEGDADADATDDAAADADADAGDLAKRDDLPEDVREALRKRDEQMEAMQKRLDESEEKRAAEIRKREVREWGEKIAKFDGVLPENADEKFADLADHDADLADEIVKALDALNEQVDKSALFGSAGTDLDAEEGSALAALETKSKEIAKRDDIDEVEAFAKATEENPDLYDRHLAEKGA